MNAHIKIIRVSKGGRGGGKRLPTIRRDKLVTKSDMVQEMIKKTQQAVAEQVGVAMDEDAPEAPQSLTASLRPLSAA